MTIEIERNGTRYFVHTAWMDDGQGTNFSLKEPEEPIFVGNYVDTSSAESTDYRKYAWRQAEDIQEGELSQEDIYDDMEPENDTSDDELEIIYQVTLVNYPDIEEVEEFDSEKEAIDYAKENQVDYDDMEQ